MNEFPATFAWPVSLLEPVRAVKAQNAGKPLPSCGRHPICRTKTTNRGWCHWLAEDSWGRHRDWRSCVRCGSLCEGGNNWEPMSSRAVGEIS